MRACSECGQQPELKKRKAGKCVYVQYRCPVCGRATGWISWGNRDLAARNWDSRNGGEQE